MKKGFSLLEILVALAIFGLLSGLVLSSLLGLFRINRSGNLEARAVVVAKDFLERAVKEGTYANNTLTLPKPSQTGGFTWQVAAAGRPNVNQSLSFQTCAATTSAYTCNVSCSGSACALVAVRLTLTAGGKSYVFYREWAP
ncbi:MULTISPECIES: type IV pilus modification PilV family protein [Thermus]|uniref:Type II secretion system protein n=1 Tax=Thermus brockianus TaxID=56956 RepID=A0A1J0LTB6_THEBO|nr:MULTISPECIES: prepilin-type N-terminal cleavage/methylation domain-containing protein [Thermus]APD08701.1 hypothetical protein A0O31_00493 [Thermus brockianus]KHG66276.1 hypothetical protein QT17_03000 [Thermus sp. 2.9]BDG15939.1 hypothetical protein TbrSNM41_06730 [Thermus brockianus]